MAIIYEEDVNERLVTGLNDFGVGGVEGREPVYTFSLPDNSFSTFIENFNVTRKYPANGRISQSELKGLLHHEMKARVEEYDNENNNIIMGKKRILCILGESGVGKTLASLYLKKHCGANVICSYTTRPPRENEIEGREHHFIDVAQPRERMLAYAKYGDYYYYALKSQVFGPLTIYVIDQAGLEALKRENGEEYEIFTVYIMRDRRTRLKQGVDRYRMYRDRDKNTMSLDEYDFVIDNNSTKRELFNNIERIYNQLKEGGDNGSSK